VSALLAIDFGNTRLKARCGALRHACSAGDPAAFERWLEGLPEARLVAWSCVAGPERESWLERVCRARGLRIWRDLRPDLARGGVRCDLEQPARVGADRLWAAAGATRLLGRSCLVVQAGTCLVVDAVEARGATSRLLGGAIAPGLVLLERALHEGTAALPLVDARSMPRPGALGLGTEEACISGVWHGLRGAAIELCARIAEESGFVGAPACVTGGDHALVASALRAAGCAAHEAPELVLDSLEHALAEIAAC
jgi:type III pantothenate kinase